MSGYIGVQPVPKATQRREYFTATNGQTSFTTSGYTPEYIDVYMNGVKLSPADFTATNGSDVVLGSGAATGDLLQIISFLPFSVLNQAFSGTLSVAGAVTANAGVVVDNITIDGNEIDVSSGNLMLDVAGYIELSSDDVGGSVYFSDGGTTYGRIYNSSSNLRIKSQIGDKSISFEGVDGSNPITALTLDMSDGGTATFNHDIKLGDGGIAKFGAGDDLQIYHDGTNSYIKDVGTGDLLIQATDQIKFKKADGSEYHAIFADGGSVDLYYAGVEKFKTASGGVDVTGTVTSGGLIGNATNFDIIQNTSDGSDSKRTRIGGGGDVVSSRGAMVEMSGNEHGNGGMLFLHAGHGGSYSQIRSYTAGQERTRLDASGNLGIGTTTIGDKLVVQGTSSATASIVIQDPTANDYGTHLSYDDANSKAIFGGLTNGTKNPALSVARDAASGIEIDSSGNVGIGTTSPNNKLDVNGGIVCSPNTDGKDTFELSTHASDEGRLRIKNVDTTTVQIRAGGDSYFNGGNVVVGGSAPDTDISGATPKLQIIGTGVAASASITRRENNQYAPTLFLTKSRNTAVGSNTIVNNGDALGVIAFIGDDGTNLDTYGATITATVDATPSANDMPTRLSFSVTADGASSPTEQMRIHSGGQVSIPNGVELGSGIDGTNANTLNDYEEGTWTAGILGSTMSANNTTGYYRKVGRLVSVSWYSGPANFENTTGSTAQITGLPFTSSHATQHYGGGFLPHTNAFSHTCHTGYVSNNNTTFVPTRADSPVASTSFGNYNTRYIMFNAVYMTAES